jgi:hypothetical protein
MSIFDMRKKLAEVGLLHEETRTFDEAFADLQRASQRQDYDLLVYEDYWCRKVWDNDCDTWSFCSDDEDRKKQYFLSESKFESRKAKKMSNCDDGIFHCDFLEEENIIGGFFNTILDSSESYDSNDHGHTTTEYHREVLSSLRRNLRRVNKMSNFDDGVFHVDFFFEENIIGGFFNL